MHLENSSGSSLRATFPEGTGVWEERAQEDPESLLAGWFPFNKTFTGVIYKCSGCTVLGSENNS